MVNKADEGVTNGSGLLSSHPRRVLYFVNAIKISISFPTSILVISHLVTFCSVTTYIQFEFESWKSDFSDRIKWDFFLCCSSVNTIV